MLENLTDNMYSCRIVFEINIVLLKIAHQLLKGIKEQITIYGLGI